jgi:hypothetical protein
LKYQLDPRPLPKSKGLSAWGKGLEGKGRGSDKGPITVAEGVLGRSGCCHGRGRGFESRRPRHFKSGTYSAERGRRPGPTPSACCRETRTPPASRPPSPPRHRQNQSGSPAWATTACLKGEAAVTRALANLRRFRRRTAEAPDCPGAVGADPELRCKLPRILLDYVRGQPDGAVDQCEPLRVRVPRPYVVQLQVVQTDATVGYIALRQ